MIFSRTAQIFLGDVASKIGKYKSGHDCPFIKSLDLNQILFTLCLWQKQSKFTL